MPESGSRTLRTAQSERSRIPLSWGRGLYVVKRNGDVCLWRYSAPIETRYPALRGIGRQADNDSSLVLTASLTEEEICPFPITVGRNNKRRGFLRA
jgi:hypothetical protein